MEREAQKRDLQRILAARSENERRATAADLREQNIQRGRKLESLARSLGWPPRGERADD
jgi:urease accessory protein UreF